MLRAGTKRFYKTVASERRDGAFRILLDGRTLKSPSGGELRLPTAGLAQAVAEEWAAQAGTVEPATMPLTVMAWAADELTERRREQIIDDLAAYGAHDLLCYRAEGPADLTARQQAAWQPLLDWAARELDAPLAIAAGIVSRPQPAASLAALHRAVAALDQVELAALATAVKAAGSLVIGLALRAGHIDANAACAAAQLDETYQMERWGDDPEAARRRAAVESDLIATARVFTLLRDGRA